MNLSEGRRADVVASIAAEAGACLLDVHSDADHHRSVLTLAGDGVETAARAVTEAAVDRLDLRSHRGAHPRFGVVDVVPFVPLSGSVMGDAVAARDAFAAWAGATLGLPCFLYGPCAGEGDGGGEGHGGRSLPEVRAGAFGAFPPDTGPPVPHPTAGAIATGARPVLVAYNLWLAPPSGADVARELAASLRGPSVRALGLQVGDRAQVSCNLLDPLAVGPGAVFDAVAAGAPVERAELVGLVPAAVLAAEPASRWAELDLHPSRTIEARLAAHRNHEAGLGGSCGEGRRLSG
jgi:glutamate formiminotransferase